MSVTPDHRLSTGFGGCPRGFSRQMLLTMTPVERRRDTTTQMRSAVWELLALFDPIRKALPAGNLLPDDVWGQRHRVIVVLLWLHIPALVLFGVVMGEDVAHSSSEVALVAACALLASWQRLGRTLRASFATLGLMTASAIVVHLSGGYIEAHFHFFVMLGVITLYQSWVPFLLALTYVVVHHGVLGAIVPDAVFNHPDAWVSPWKWALIHAGFILAGSIAYLAAWRLNEYQALHDPLTRLANRALFRDRIRHAAARADRRGGPLAVMVLDLDDFKQVNDTLGHSAGDELLNGIALRLRGAVRSADTVARLGGDEFALVIDGAPNEAVIRAVAKRVLGVFEEPFIVHGEPMRTSASLGVVIAGRRHTVEELVRQADVAMYQAKAAGNGRVAFFDGGRVSSGASGLKVVAAG
jgi:diguanylate cyclase (GGDEF)-like protein